MLSEPSIIWRCIQTRSLELFTSKTKYKLTFLHAKWMVSYAVKLKIILICRITIQQHFERSNSQPFKLALLKAKWYDQQSPLSTIRNTTLLKSFWLKQKLKKHKAPKQQIKSRFDHHKKKVIYSQPLASSSPSPLSPLPPPPEIIADMLFPAFEAVMLFFVFFFATCSAFDRPA